MGWSHKYQSVLEGLLARYQGAEVEKRKALIVRAVKEIEAYHEREGLEESLPGNLTEVCLFLTLSSPTIGLADTIYRR